MSLGGIAITMNQSTPSGTSQAGLAPQDFQSVKTTFQQALDSEHIFPSTNGVAGAHRKGSAVAFVGTASQVSSADTDGRLMVTSDTSRLYHVGSGVTVKLGSRFDVESSPLVTVLTPGNNANITSKVTQILAMEVGVMTMPRSSTGTIVLLQRAYVSATILVAPAIGNIGFGSLVTLGGVPVAGVLAQGGSSFVMSNYQYTSAGTAIEALSTNTYVVSYLVAGIASG